MTARGNDVSAGESFKSNEEPLTYASKWILFLWCPRMMSFHWPNQRYGRVRLHEICLLRPGRDSSSDTSDSMLISIQTSSEYNLW